MLDTFSNLHLIRLMTKQGHEPAVVMKRCCEHLGWQGPHPTLREIEQHMQFYRSRAPSPPVAVPVVTPALMATGTADNNERNHT